MKRTLALLLTLSGCANPNPNIYTYGWRPPPPPDPNGRSFMGYDPAYEQALIAATSPAIGSRFRYSERKTGLMTDPAADTRCSVLPRREIPVKLLQQPSGCRPP
jgi:hypothetical protein